MFGAKDMFESVDLLSMLPRQNSFSASPTRLMNKRVVGAKVVSFVCSREREDKFSARP